MNAASNARIIRCPKCGANNRVAAETKGREPICGRCKTPLSFVGHPVTVTDRNFDEVITKSPLPALIDFWAAWCGPCRLIAPVIDQLAQDLVGKVVIGKLNVDENQMTAARFGVQSIPTLLILKNGREVDRIVGAQPKETILRRLQNYM
jgi:thioredoxin 2